jgi:hypothetical protein
MKNEIILYRPDEVAKHIEARIDEENETVWLNQYQSAELFQTDRTSIIKHLQNIYSSGELDEKATCSKIAQVKREGKRLVTRDVLHYNLDIILSVGYRVNSKQGMDRIENGYENLRKEVQQISLQLITQAEFKPLMQLLG